MTVDELRQRVAAALEIDPSLLDENTGPDSLPAWDSMGHLRVISLLDDLVKEPIEPEDAEDLITFGDIVEFLKARNVLGNGSH